jgi:hypothetical protein
MRLWTESKMRLWTDFNYMEDENRLRANLDRAAHYLEEEVRVGQVAELFDGLGYECLATVISVDEENRSVELEPDWNTWRSSKDSARDKELVASTTQKAYFAHAGMR